MTPEKRTKLYFLLGCLVTIILLCGCAFLAFVAYIVVTFDWGTGYKNNMHEQEFREQIEKWIDLQFPPSAEFEKSEYNAWLDADFQCLFTLPRKDIDIMFPPEKTILSYYYSNEDLPPNEVTWHENDHDMLPYYSKDWLERKKLDHFKVIQYSTRSRCNVTVVIENPAETDENQRIWVYICFFTT